MNYQSLYDFTIARATGEVQFGKEWFEYWPNYGTWKITKYAEEVTSLKYENGSFKKLYFTNKEIKFLGVNYSRIFQEAITKARR